MFGIYQMADLNPAQVAISQRMPALHQLPPQTAPLLVAVNHQQPDFSQLKQRACQLRPIEQLKALPTHRIKQWGETWLRQIDQA